MNLKEARYIMSIYKNKSITKAARELYISQPSLSRYLQNLERTLGFPLFNRSGNEYIPTYYGRRYLDYAGRILLLGNEWMKEYHELKNEEKGELSIALPLMRSSDIIPKILPAFVEKYPNVHITLKEETHSISENSLLNDDLDFALYTPGSRSHLLDYCLVSREVFVLACAHGHPLCAKAVQKPGLPYPWIDLSQCADESFVLHLPSQHSGKNARRLFKKYDMAPAILLQTCNTEVALSLAASGTGLAFAPESYALRMQKLHKLSLFCVGDPVEYVELMLVYRNGKFLTAYAQEFMRLVMEHS